MTPTVALPRAAARVRTGLSHSANWWQAVRFLAVGASGFAINLIVFSALVHGAGVDYRLGALCSNLIALTNNFLWNRHWTFDAAGGSAALQAPRFALVSACGIVLNLVFLQLAVEVLGLPRLPSEVLASALVAPVNFLGSRQWAFRSGATAPSPG